MNEYEICTDFVEIVTGEKSRTAPVYQEATKAIDKDGNAALKNLKGFIVSIEEVSEKEIVKDTRISKTRGNLKKFDKYENIEVMFKFFKKYLPGNETVKSLNTIHDSLISYNSLYSDAYEKNAKLVMLEYENGVYMLVTGIVFVAVNNIDISEKDGKIHVKAKGKATSGFGVISKNIREFAREISSKDHKKYIETIIKQMENVKANTNIKESIDMTFTEANAISMLKVIGSLWDNTVLLGKSVISGLKIVKNSLFGIIPLIRSVLYLRFKRKADTVLALEEQTEFIERNINQLENKDMDPKKKEEIIKKQKAVIERYKKKSEKLRAELVETEKEAATELKADDQKIRETKNDDDFILEMVGFASDWEEYYG